MNIRRLEGSLEHLIHTTREATTDKSLKLQLRNGLGARHYVLRRCREYLEKECFDEKEIPLSPDGTTEAALFLNSYYLNLRGALDNIAWSIQLKFTILPGVTEKSSKRTRINLFGKDFLENIEIKLPECASLISEYKAWGLDLAQFRDPAAHRIPLYVPPNMITKQSQLDEFQRLNELSSAPTNELGGKTRADLIQEARNVAPYLPVFCVTAQDGSIVTYSISGRLLDDHEHYLKLTLGILANF